MNQENEIITQTKGIKNVVPWIPVIELAVLAFTTLGTTITLSLHSDKKMESSRKETNQIIELIRQDLRDYHGKMERQDADFKNHIMYEHERKK